MSIELRHVQKSYAEGQLATHAVKDLSLTFPSGEITALLGPSGCGKTTTLRMINRLIEPTSGQILLNGQDTQLERPELLRRRMGYVIQQIGLFPHLSVLDNVTTVPQLLGQPKAQARAHARELLDLVGLGAAEFAHKRPQQLSGGQQQRVGVARALAADPPVLLMDEPFGALDPLARTRLQDAFLEIQARLKKTVIMVTHDIDEALRMAGYIALLRAGELVQFGTPDDLVRRPANDFVRQFLGEDAFLRQLAGQQIGDLLRPTPFAGTPFTVSEVPDLPRVDFTLDARSALSVMLREGARGVAVTRGGEVVGTVDFAELARGAP